MEIAENLETWQSQFDSGWSAHLDATGELDWKLYPKLKNESSPAGSATSLGACRLGLISTAGAYVKAEQEPFAAADPRGDYSLRTFPVTTPFEALDYAHDHYDHTAVEQDAQVLLPTGHLTDLVAEGRLGELAPDVISFSGYQPDLGRVVGELIPAVLDAVRTAKLEAALLVPS